jgi:hypothetical protein
MTFYADVRRRIPAMVFACHLSERRYVSSRGPTAAPGVVDDAGPYHATPCRAGVLRRQAPSAVPNLGRFPMDRN